MPDLHSNTVFVSKDHASRYGSKAFGIAITESLYFGCPVFGTPYGLLPGLVTSEFDFLSGRKSEIVDALKYVDQYDRKKYHEYVCANFTAKQMTEKYLGLYEKVLNGQKLNSILLI